MVGIHAWSPFHERFGRKPSSGESYCLAFRRFDFRSAFSSLYPLIKFFLLTGRRGVRRERAPIPAFRQSDSSARPVPVVAANEGIRALATSHIASAPKPGRLKAASWPDNPVLTVILVDKPSQGDSEETLSKRRRVMSKGVSSIETALRDVPVSGKEETTVVGARVWGPLRSFQVVHRLFNRFVPLLRPVIGRRA